MRVVWTVWPSASARAWAARRKAAARTRGSLRRGCGSPRDRVIARMVAIASLLFATGLWRGLIQLGADLANGVDAAAQAVALGRVWLELQVGGDIGGGEQRLAHRQAQQTAVAQFLR